MQLTSFYQSQMKSRSSRLLIPSLLLVAAIVVALNGWFGFRAIRSLHESEYWVARTWQVINKVTYPQDARYSKHIFVVAPGLTVKSRLQVLEPAGKNNFYDEFNIVPPALLDKLR